MGKTLDTRALGRTRRKVGTSMRSLLAVGMLTTGLEPANQPLERAAF